MSNSLDSFPNAAEMEKLSSNLPLIWTEISAIQQAILTASTSNLMSTTVLGTTMTSTSSVPSIYWQVWSGTATNKTVLLQLNAVLSYFASLSYVIAIQTNPATGATIQWKVTW